MGPNPQATNPTNVKERTISEYSEINLADNLRPRVPKGDDPEAVNAVANTVLERTRVWSDELRAIANAHVDPAPTSSEHVLDLDAAIARAVLRWVELWPR
jgi:hypothetical protein